MITYALLATEPTVKLLEVSAPDAVTVHDGLVATLTGVIVQVPASAVEKPLPVKVTRAPIIPDDGVSEIVGPSTVNVACASSPVFP